MPPQNEMPKTQTNASHRKKLITIGVICVVLVVLIILIGQSTTVQKMLKQYGKEREKSALESKQNDFVPEGAGTAETETNSETGTSGGASTTGGSTTTTGTGTTTSSAESLSQSEMYTVTTKKDVTYGTGSGLTLKVDIYTPDDVSAPTPAILYIHGGGFKGGNKNGVANDAIMLAKHGAAVVAIDYRLSGTAVFPAPLHDVKAVARYVKAYASEYNIDPNALFALGESAGGVLASLMGVTEGNTTLEGVVGGNTGYSSNIAGVINISGSYVASIVDTMSDGIKNSISNETGCSPVPSTTCKSTYEALSAETYISSGDSPFLILHGGKDRSVPQIQAETLHSKLLAAGIASEIHIAPDLAHVGGLLNRYLTQVINFVNRNS